MTAGITGAAAAVPAAAPSPIVADAAPLADDTAETVPDVAETLAQEVSRRAEVLLLAAQTSQTEQQARLDRMRSDFNAAQEEHTELEREMNALRDMALEQAKKDDEVLKKFIAMI